MRNVLITGANRGIGLALAKVYLGRGDRVFATCRHPTSATELHRLSAENEGKLCVVPLDVGDAMAIADAVARVSKDAPSLDLLVNNAGIYHAGQNEDAEKFGALTFEAGLAVLRTNALGPVLIAQAFLPLLAAGTNPKVANITSGYGSLAGNDKGNAPYHYAASKAALNMLTRSLAADLMKSGVVAAVIDPGWVRTDMGGTGAPLAPEESAAGIAAVIDDLIGDHAGQFFDYRGHTVPW